MYRIWMRGPLLPNWKSELDFKNITLLERLSDGSYTARLTPIERRIVQDFSFVSHVEVFVSAERVDAAVTQDQTPRIGHGMREMKTWDVLLHRPDDLGAVLNRLQTLGGMIAGTGRKKIRVYLLEGSPALQQIAQMAEVSQVAAYVPPKLFNDVAREILGIDTRSSDSAAKVTTLPQTGKGQIIGIADTGLDDAHPDFKGRIIGLIPLGRPTDTSDPDGHGTHVAGSALGDGAASTGEIKGVAPEAKLFFQSIMDANGRLGGLPIDLWDLFEEAYLSGIRIHNNSWGAATEAVYNANAMEVDEFVAARPDMLIVIAAGNEGQASAQRVAVGHVDTLSLGSPATSKNALTVGASRSSRKTGGLSNLTHSQAWPKEFPHPPIANDLISGDAECLAGFSSRGPCDDRRIKPDVVAPGTDIVSTKSSRAPLHKFAGAYSNARYAYMAGTSMATPLVSGCAALIRQYYLERPEGSHEPSAALLKATLINSTKPLQGWDAGGNAKIPNEHQGFGRVYMPWAIPHADIPWMKLEFLDGGYIFTQTGQAARFEFEVDGGDWLRLCLCWTDHPGRALQNNLNIILEHTPTRQK